MQDTNMSKVLPCHRGMLLPRKMHTPFVAITLVKKPLTRLRLVGRDILGVLLENLADGRCIEADEAEQVQHVHGHRPQALQRLVDGRQLRMTRKCTLFSCIRRLPHDAPAPGKHAGSVTMS